MHQSAGFLRLNQIIGNKSTGERPLIPISRSSWLAGVKLGRFPNPLKIGRCTVWRTTDIAEFIKNPNSYNHTKEVTSKESK